MPSSSVASSPTNTGTRPAKAGSARKARTTAPFETAALLDLDHALAAQGLPVRAAGDARRRSSARTAPPAPGSTGSARPGPPACFRSAGRDGGRPGLAPPRPRPRAARPNARGCARRRGAVRRRARPPQAAAAARGRASRSASGRPLTTTSAPSSARCRRCKVGTTHDGSCTRADAARSAPACRRSPETAPRSRGSGGGGSGEAGGSDAPATVPKCSRRATRRRNAAPAAAALRRAVQAQAALGSALSGAALIERRSCADAAVLQHDHAAGGGDRLGPVGDDDARQLQLADRLVHLPLAVDVERARRLVEEQDLRPLVQRARQQDALLLAARQAAPMSPISVW